jgi:signal transduction histidine kinase
MCSSKPDERVITHKSISALVRIAVAIAVITPPHSVRAAVHQKQVLVLYAARRDAPPVAAADRELPRVLEASLPFRIAYHSEFIDPARFPQPRYLRAFREFLRLKYHGVRFDLVVAMGDAPLQFLHGYRDGLVPGAPMVFLARRRPAAHALRNATGVIAPLDVASTMTLATTLQPDARNLFVVSGPGVTNQIYERMARTQLRSFESRLAVTYLSGLRTPDLERRLAGLPDRSIVYYLAGDRDGAAETFQPVQHLDRVAAAANAPVYCWVDCAMAGGVVGARLKDQSAEARAVGHLAARVLRGERADTIPIAAASLTVSQVDWRQLRRWGISEGRVPPGVLIRFKTPPASGGDRPYVLGTLALLLAQAALIAGLLVQRRRFRRAEARARLRQSELRANYERIRDLGARLLSAQETERSQIAVELHDDIGQQLAVLTIDLQLASETGDNRVSTALARAQSIATNLHDLSDRVHPAKLRLIGLLPALEALERELSESEMAIVVTHENVPPMLPHDLTLPLFRVVQEAVQNALEHSHARAVSVHLHGESDAVLALTIADDGVGFDLAAARRNGLGLLSMSERVEAMGGNLYIVSRPGGGTRLEIRVPVPIAKGIPAEV